MQNCRSITRKSASNLAMAFILLPREKRDSMAALYAFCRKVDDVADDESVPLEERRRLLAEWRADIRRACDGAEPVQPVNKELQPVINRYKLPFNYFDELIRGVEMDLDIKRYQTFDDLEQYCYRVASVVGLLSIEIFGYRDTACRDYAIYLGKALQLTNILRDVGGDAACGRIYIPLQLLEQCGVTQEEILQGKHSERFVQAALQVAGRATGFFRMARQTLPPSERRAMAAAELMGTVYWHLLQKLKRQNFPVLGPKRMRLGRCHKLWLIGVAWWRLATGGQQGYGTD